MSAFGEGAPCWADVSLPDLAAGRRFYGELFGWSFEDQGEDYWHYTVALRDGKYAAALMGKTDPSMPPAWSVHLATADAAKTAAKVTEAGGRVLFGPDKVADRGVMAGATDPGGSFFGIWQAGRNQGFAITNEPGAYSWAENHTRDAAAVDGFYSAVFGYEAQQVGDGVHFDYKVWSLPGRTDGPVLGRMNRAADLAADHPSAFLTYFTVADCDEAVAGVQRLGGRVAGEPSDSPFGRVAVVSDDQGAEFAVIDVRRKAGQAPG